MSIDLTQLHGCLSELQDCSNGLAQLDHLLAQAIDAETEQQATWDSVESEALREVRADPTKAYKTATEVKGGVTHWVEQRPHARKARDHLRETQATKEKLGRFARSLEKRMSAAQSAANIHGQMGKYGGG